MSGVQGRGWREAGCVNLLMLHLITFPIYLKEAGTQARAGTALSGYRDLPALISLLNQEAKRTL